MDYGSLPSKSPRQIKQKAKQPNKQKNQQLQMSNEGKQAKQKQQLQKQYRQWPYPYSKLVYLLVTLMIIVCSCVGVLTLLIIIKKDGFLASASISFTLSSSCQQYLVSKYAAGNYPIQLKVTSVSLAICIILALILLLILLIKRRTTFCCDQDLIKETYNQKTNSKKQQKFPQQKKSEKFQKDNNELSQLKDKMRKPSYKKQSHYQKKRNKFNQSKQPLLDKQPINQKAIIYRSNLINKFPFKPSYLLTFSILLVFMVIPLGHHLTYYSEWKHCGSYDIDEKVIYILIGLEGLSIIVGSIAFLVILCQYRKLKEIQSTQNDDQQLSDKSVSDQLLSQNEQPKKEDIVQKNQKQPSIQPQPQPKPQLEIQPIKQPKIGQQNPSKVIQTDFDKPKKPKKQKVPVEKQESEDIDEQPVLKNTQEKQVSNNANTGPNKNDNLNLNLKLNLKPSVQQVYDVNISSTSDNKINLSLSVDQDKNKPQSKPQNKKDFKKSNKNQRHRQQDKTITSTKNKQTNPRFNRLSSNIVNERIDNSNKKPQSLINQGQAVNNLSNQIIIDSDAKLRKSRTFSIINIQPIIVGQVKIKPQQQVPQKDQLGNEMPLKQGQIVNNDVLQKPLKQQETIKPKQIQMIAMKLVRKSLNFTNSIYSIQQASPTNFFAQNVHTSKEHPTLLSGHQSNQKLQKTIERQKSEKNIQRFDPTNTKNIMSQQQLPKQSLNKVQGLVPQKQQVYGTYLNQRQNQNKQEQNYRSGSSYYHSIKKQINSEHRIIQEPVKNKIGLQIKALDDNSTEEHMKSKISSPINRKSHPNGNSPIIRRQNFFTDIDEEQRQGLQAQSKNKYTKYFEKKKKQFDNTIREQRQKELQERIRTLEKRQKAIQNKQQDQLRDKVIQESIRYLNQNNYNSVLRPLVQQNRRVQQLQKSPDSIIQTGNQNQVQNIQKDNKSVSPNKKGKAKRQKSKKELYPEIQKNQSRQISRQSFLNGQPQIVVNRDSRQESSEEAQSQPQQDQLEHQTPLIRKLYRDMKVVKYRQKIFNKTKSQSNIRIQQDQVPIHQPKRSSFSNPKRNIYSPRSKKLYFEQIYQPLSNRFVLLTPKKKQK